MTHRRDYSEIEPFGGRIRLYISVESSKKQIKSYGLIKTDDQKGLFQNCIFDLNSKNIVAIYLNGFEFPPIDIRKISPRLVFIASDSDGRWGRSCPKCNKQFRIGHHPMIGACCPYCGTAGFDLCFFTEAQVTFCRETISAIDSALLEAEQTGEYFISLDDLAKKANRVSTVKAYGHKSLQTEFTCEYCGQYTDLIGRFGFCSLCRRRNNFQYLNEKFILLQSKVSSDKVSVEEALKQAIDLFDACAKDLLNTLLNTVKCPTKRSDDNQLRKFVFHDFDRIEIKKILDTFDIDLKGCIPSGAENFLKIMLERRNLHSHRHGVVDQKYLERTGDNSVTEGEILREIPENFSSLLFVLSGVLAGFQLEFEKHISLRLEL